MELQQGTLFISARFGVLYTVRCTAVVDRVVAAHKTSLRARVIMGRWSTMPSTENARRHDGWHIMCTTRRDFAVEAGCEGGQPYKHAHNIELARGRRFHVENTPAYVPPNPSSFWQLGSSTRIMVKNCCVTVDQKRRYQKVYQDYRYLAKSNVDYSVLL